MTRIILVYFDAGGGHRSAALSIQQAVQRAGLPWQVELFNLQEALDPIDVIRRLTGLRIQDTYNRMLQNGWTLGSPELMRALQGLIWAFHRPTVKLLARQWATLKPDLLVSVVPHFNRALDQSLARALPGTPFVTILTDIADYPPHFWIERQQQYLVCGSEKAEEQARAMGHSSGIFRTSGMILSPRFYDYSKIDRTEERKKLGLDPDRMTGLVLFGGQGARRTMLQIDRLLDCAGLPIQLILICGKNDELAKALRAQRSSLPRWIEGFTTNVPYYMQLADFFIGKPGPGSIAEAVSMGLPVIVERNAWTLPQERYNTVWVREKQVGLVLRSFSGIADAVAQLLLPENFSRFRENAQGIHNRALFEIPPIFESILAQAGQTSAAPTKEISQSNDRSSQRALRQWFTGALF